MCNSNMIPLISRVQLSNAFSWRLPLFFIAEIKMKTPHTNGKNGKSFFTKKELIGSRLSVKCITDTSSTEPETPTDIRQNQRIR